MRSASLSILLLCGTIREVPSPRLGDHIHTHFGSATFLGAVFFPLLILLSFWRMAWMHVLSWGKKNGNRHAQGFAKAALFQSG